MFRLLKTCWLAVLASLLLASHTASAAPITRVVVGEVLGAGPNPFGLVTGGTVTFEVEFDDAIGNGLHLVNALVGSTETFFFKLEKAEFTEKDDSCYLDPTAAGCGLGPYFETFENEIQALLAE